MKRSRSRKGVSGSSTLPSSIPDPSPFAHHSLEWKPLPEKVTARRMGGSVSLRFVADAARSWSDSSHGSDIETPTPRRKVRRERDGYFMGLLGVGEVRDCDEVIAHLGVRCHGCSGTGG